MAKETPTGKDRWDKLESFAKTLAGVCAAAGAILIPIFINHYTEESRKSQVYLQMMTEREKSDTSIRENMFKILMDGYLQAVKEDAQKEDLESFRKRVIFLELLAVNFQEFFNAKPLFEEVYERLVKYRGTVKDEQTRNAWIELEKKITSVAREIASGQATTLNTLGESVLFTMRKDEVGCIRLYDKADFGTLRKRDGTTRFHIFEYGQCLRDLEKEEEGKAGTPTPKSQEQNEKQSLTTKGYHKQQSIELRVREIGDANVKVSVTVYADFFDRRNVYVGSERGRGFPVNVSYFDLPYTDNTQLADGNRFSLVLKRIYKPGGNENVEADIEAIRFKNDFMSMKDRPLFEEMLKKLQQSPTTR